MGTDLAAQLGHMCRTVDMFQTLGTSPLRKVIEQYGYYQNTNPKHTLSLLTLQLLSRKIKEV